MQSRRLCIFLLRNAAKSMQTGTHWSWVTLLLPYVCFLPSNIDPAPRFAAVGVLLTIQVQINLSGGCWLSLPWGHIAGSWSMWCPPGSPWPFLQNFSTKLGPQSIRWVTPPPCRSLHSPLLNFMRLLSVGSYLLLHDYTQIPFRVLHSCCVTWKQEKYPLWDPKYDS